MFPIRDDQPRYSTPWVNYFIIGFNAVVFLLFEVPVQMQGSRATNILLQNFALIPHDLTRALAGVPNYPLPANLLTIFTSMFLHGGWLHIIFNMWFL